MGTEKKHELVKYSNQMNKIQLHNFEAMDLNMLYLICARAQKQDDDVMEISFDDIRQATGYTSRDKMRLSGSLIEMNRKLIRCAGHYETSDEIVDFNLFSTFRVQPVTGKLVVRVNPDFRYLLCDLAKEFTVFELQEFVGLKSRYSKTLYRLLKQWRTQGHTQQYSVDEIKRLFDVEECQTKYLMRDVIKPAMQEIEKKKLFADLTCETVRDEHVAGRPTKGYIFRFRAERPPKKAVADKSEGNGSAASRRGGKKKAGFVDMEQTQDYDMDDIERALMGE